MQNPIIMNSLKGFNPKPNKARFASRGSGGKAGGIFASGGKEAASLPPAAKMHLAAKCGGKAASGGTA